MLFPVFVQECEVCRSPLDLRTMYRSLVCAVCLTTESEDTLYSGRDLQIGYDSTLIAFFLFLSALMMRVAACHFRDSQVAKLFIEVEVNYLQPQVSDRRQGNRLHLWVRTEFLNNI
jgi:hypothetical protein